MDRNAASSGEGRGDAGRRRMFGWILLPGVIAGALLGRAEYLRT
ncbi:MAG TPA: hypothetical protein VFY84_07415 [Jiangellales bacterium]|nr:hypothetical protein [Jiangellales bacterium]